MYKNIYNNVYKTGGLPGLSLPVPLLSASFCIKLSTEVFSMFLTNSLWTYKIQNNESYLLTVIFNLEFKTCRRKHNVKHV